MIKRFFVVLLAVLLLTAVAASAEGWLCSSCNEYWGEDRYNYCPICGKTRSSGIPDSKLIVSEAAGFCNDPVIVRVAFAADDTVRALYVDASTQTPDMGGKCAEAGFVSQFIGKSAPFTLGGNIDGVTNATITGTAVCNAINQVAPATAP